MMVSAKQSIDKIAYLNKHLFLPPRAKIPLNQRTSLKMDPILSIHLILIPPQDTVSISIEVFFEL